VRPRPLVNSIQEGTSPKNVGLQFSPKSVSTTKNFPSYQKRGILITNSKKHILTDGNTPKHRQSLNVNSGTSNPEHAGRKFTQHPSQNYFNELQAAIRMQQASVQGKYQSHEIAYLN